MISGSLFATSVPLRFSKPRTALFKYQMIFMLHHTGCVKTFVLIHETVAVSNDFHAASHRIVQDFALVQEQVSLTS